MSPAPVRNAELLARINGRHPLIAGYVEEVHRLYNKRATGQRKAMERDSGCRGRWTMAPIEAARKAQQSHATTTLFQW
jgi:hypothetical protein